MFVDCVCFVSFRAPRALSTVPAQGGGFANVASSGGGGFGAVASSGGGGGFGAVASSGGGGFGAVAKVRNDICLGHQYLPHPRTCMHTQK